MKTCLRCQNFFKSELNITTGNKCPLNNCNGQIVEVDENIINVHDQLKKKGYPTILTAVNPGSEFVEIIFDEMVHPEAFTYLPHDFNSEVSDNHQHQLRLYKLIIGETESKRLECIHQASIDLFEWIEKLSMSKKIKVELTLEGQNDLLQCTWELYQNFFLFPLYNDFTTTLITIVSPEKAEIIENKIWPYKNECAYECHLQIDIE